MGLLALVGPAIFYTPTVYTVQYIHRKKRFTSFSSPAGMSLSKLPMGRNNSVLTSLLPPMERGSDIPAGDRKYANLFLRCTVVFCSIHGWRIRITNADPDATFHIDIRIRILIKVMQICDYSSNRPPRLHFEPSCLQCKSSRTSIDSILSL